MAPKSKPSAKAGAQKKTEEPKVAEEDVPMEDSKGTEAGAESTEAKELETDAPPSSGKKLAAGAVGFNMADATLNVMPTSNGKLLMCLNEGGLQYLLASVRSNVGVKSGRYMFEVKIVETLCPTEPQGSRAPAPKQLVRVGLSLANSSQFLADTEDSVCFDSEGHFTSNKKRTKPAQKFGRDQTVAVVVNLDAKSPNANTLSLFIDGVRACEPQVLPENLCGKVLYPTITYRNVTLRVNFGPTPLTPLPFTCNMLQEGAAADLEIQKIAVPKDGKYEVLFPVGLPDKGVFDWADGFLEKNPSYTELSDRSILEWANKSGLRQSKTVKKVSNDQPAVKFDLPLMDDMSVRRVLNSISPMFKRNFLVMELKSNLLAEDRASGLARFAPAHFKKVAAVMLGEPSAGYKERVHKLLLADKEAKAEAEKKKREAEAERKKALEAKKKKAEEAKKAREAAQKKKKEEKEGVEEEAAEEKPDEEMKAEDEEPKAEEPEADKPVELSEEEKNTWFRKFDCPDITEDVLAKSFAKFSVPTKAEGFDDIRFEWQKEAEATKFLREYVLAAKKTQKVHDLELTDWFKEQWSTWQKETQTWKSKQKEWKDPAKRKALEKTDVEIDVENLEVFDVENIDDVGNGEPLFANFAYEDWALLAARFEQHLLIHSYQKALDDPDRPSFLEKDLKFYYQMHYKKSLNVKDFACETFDEFRDYVKDSIEVKEDGYVQAPLADDTTHAYFVKLTEENRRERERRVDAGDETARLKFPAPSQQRSQAALGGGASGANKRPAPAPVSYANSGAKKPRPGAPPPAAYGSGYGMPMGGRMLPTYTPRR